MLVDFDCVHHVVDLLLRNWKPLNLWTHIHCLLVPWEIFNSIIIICSIVRSSTICFSSYDWSSFHVLGPLQIMEFNTDIFYHTRIRSNTKKILELDHMLGFLISGGSIIICSTDCISKYVSMSSSEELCDFIKSIMLSTCVACK